MANQIPEEIIEEVRNSNDIVDVIGEYVQLKKQGKNFFGLCPFHGEKTPSFSVTQEKQIFHCFGCQKGGNVVTFLMEMESFSFMEAIQFLADRGEVSLPQINVQNKSSLSEENEHILSAYGWLTKLYHHLLKFTKEGREGYDYFKDRGIDDEAIDQFQLGFAPNMKDFTADFLKQKGFDNQMLVRAGLLSMLDDDSVTDRFRGRIIFPIRNHLGKPVGFGGRSINDDQKPKYLNSADSELFQKSKLLYNFDLAKKHIRKQNEVILFEGYMDVISAYQADVKNVVATLGTALTQQQAKLLNRYVDTVVICYDGDAAGMEATYKAANILRKVGCNIKAANLEDGTDPDSYIKENGGTAFKNEIIKASDTYISFYMRYLKKDYNLSVEGDRINYIESILRELAVIESSVEREYYLKELNEAYDISLDTLSEELNKQRRKLGRIQRNSRVTNQSTNKSIHPYHNKKILPAFHNAERSLIAYMLKDIRVAEKVQEEIGADFNVDDHKIIATHLYAFYEEGHSPDVSLFIEKLNDQAGKQLVIEIAMTPVHEEISDQVINDYIRIIRSQANDMVSIKTLKDQQKLAEQQNNPIKAAEIGKQIIDMKKQLKHIN